MSLSREASVLPLLTARDQVHRARGHHDLASGSALLCAYLSVSVSSLPIGQTDSCWRARAVFLSFSRDRAANKHGTIWMELNSSPELIWLRQPTQNCWVVTLSRKSQNIKCHLLLAISLLWTQDKPEMVLSDLVFFGGSPEKTWGVSAKEKIKSSFQIWK